MPIDMNNNFKYTLNADEYTWKNALLWGNCIGHVKKICEGRLGDRTVHALIALAELPPIIGQIVSIAEKFIVTSNAIQTTEPHSSLQIERNDDQESSNLNLYPPEIANITSRISVESQINSFKAIDGCKVYGENDEQVEIALLGDRVNHDTQFFAWKLHISANPENAGQILAAIKGVLLEHKPHFKFIKNEELIDEYNSFENPVFPERGRFKEGKFITIYAKNEEEISFLARDLDTALQKALKDRVINIDVPNPSVCRTDRPIGRTGLLWARHDQAGCPITDIDFKEGTHAAAAIGNYHVTTYFPLDWAFECEPQEMERKIQNKDVGVITKVHTDIFEKDWGVVTWNSETQRFEI